MSGIEPLNTPSHASMSTLVGYLEGHSSVQSVDYMSANVVRIDRHNMPALTACFVDEYIMGYASVLKALQQSPGVDAIVNTSAWNQNTTDAKLECANRGVGLFTFKEFMGAINYEGKKFLEYEAPTDADKSKRKRKFP